MLSCYVLVLSFCDSCVIKEQPFYAWLCFIYDVMYYGCRKIPLQTFILVVGDYSAVPS